MATMYAKLEQRMIGIRSSKEYDQVRQQARSHIGESTKTLHHQVSIMPTEKTRSLSKTKHSCPDDTHAYNSNPAHLDTLETVQEYKVIDHHRYKRSKNLLNRNSQLNYLEIEGFQRNYLNKPNYAGLKMKEEYCDVGWNIKDPALYKDIRIMALQD